MELDGHIVEFLESGALRLGYVRRRGQRKLQVIDPRGRESSVPVSRVVVVHSAVPEEALEGPQNPSRSASIRFALTSTLNSYGNRSIQNRGNSIRSNSPNPISASLLLNLNPQYFVGWPTEGYFLNATATASNPGPDSRLNPTGSGSRANRKRRIFESMSATF